MSVLRAGHTKRRIAGLESILNWPSLTKYIVDAP